MTRGEWIRQATDEEISRMLCEYNEDCNACPGYDLCGWGEGKANGFLKWLRQEKEDE